MKETSKMERRMEKEYTLGQMALTTKVSTKMT